MPGVQSRINRNTETLTMKIRLAAAAFALASTSALAAVPANDSHDLTRQYEGWAGGRANAGALVAGLQNGSTIIITTAGPNNTRSLAGFTPQAPLSPGEASAALAHARSTLASMGVRNPSAEQIQAALIGGEVTLADGRTRAVQGSVAVQADTVAVR